MGRTQIRRRWVSWLSVRLRLSDAPADDLLPYPELPSRRLGFPPKVTAPKPRRRVRGGTTFEQRPSPLWTRSECMDPGLSPCQGENYPEPTRIDRGHHRVPATSKFMPRTYPRTVSSPAHW